MECDYFMVNEVKARICRAFTWGAGAVRRCGVRVSAEPPEDIHPFFLTKASMKSTSVVTLSTVTAL